MSTLFAPKSAQQLRNAIEMLGIDLGLDKGLRNSLLTLMVQRSRVLDFVCDAAVRLSTLMAACYKDGYIEFVYLRLNASSRSPITESRFKKEFAAVWKAGGPGGSFSLEGDAVLFSAMEHSFKGAPYRLKFSFMPMACALLSIFVNNASTTEKAKIFRPNSQMPREDLTSDELAAELRRWVHIWLNEKTLSEHRIKQASAFHSFLSGLRSASAKFYEKDGVGFVEVSFPHTLAAAGQTKANADSIKSIPSGVAGKPTEPVYKHAEFEIPGNDNTRPNSMAVGHEDQVAPVQAEDASRFDGWVCEPMVITPWHRSVWPIASGQFEQGISPVVGISHLRRERLTSDIDDDFILLFWREITRDEVHSSQLGFRKFRTVARALLDYKKASSLAEDAYNPDFAQSLVRADGSEIEFEENVGVASTSPLQELMRLDRVKWLLGTRLKPLFSIMEGTAGTKDGRDGDHFKDASAEPDHEQLDGAEANEEGQSLFGHGPPDRDFSRTLLRYNSFGSQQELVMKKSSLAAASYNEFAGEIIEIEKSLREAAFATAYCLIQTGDVAGLYLLEFAQPGAIEELGLGSVVKSFAVDLGEVADHARSQISHDGSSIGKQLLSAYNAINRVGFRKRPSDLEDPAVLDALERGAQPLRDLLEAISRVRGWYAIKTDSGQYTVRTAIAEAFECDREIFGQIFDRMYAPTAKKESAH